MSDSLWFYDEQTTKKKTWWRRLRPTLSVTTNQIEESNDYLDYLRSYSSHSISSPFGIEHVAHLNDDSNFGFNELFPNVDNDLLSDFNIVLAKDDRGKETTSKNKTSPITKKLGYSSFVTTPTTPTTPTSPTYKKSSTGATYNLNKSISNNSNNSTEKKKEKLLTINELNAKLNQSLKSDTSEKPLPPITSPKQLDKKKSKDRSDIFNELNLKYNANVNQDPFLNWSPSQTTNPSIFNLNLTPNSSSEELLESIINFKIVGELSQFSRKNKSPHRYKGSIDDFNEVLNHDDLNALDDDFGDDEEEEDGFEYVKKIIDKSFKYQSVLLPEL